MRAMTRGADTAAVFGLALLLFGTSVTDFKMRPTDVSALRVLAGDVPYRDFWTMYAPGSFVTLAGAFGLFGRQLIISNLLGILTSAGAVAALYRLARPVTGRPAAFGLAGLVTAAFYGTGYHSGFTSYPPALLLIVSAIATAGRGCTTPGWRWAVMPAALLGLAALFKHDIAGYAALSAGAAILIVRWNARVVPLWAPVFAMGGVAAALPAGAALALVLQGAGPDLWNDLIAFPVGDFRYVRGEYFPLIPAWQSTLTGNLFELRQWAICNLPTVSIAVGLISLRRHWRRVEPEVLFLAAFASIVCCFHWTAAHVQINTNAISLAAWGAAAAGVGLHAAGPSSWTKVRSVALLVVFGWSLLFLSEPVYRVATNPASREWLDLPGLRGISVFHPGAARWRGLAEALAAAAPSDAPLLFISNRNDVVVYAQPAPFWLSPRRPATRNHEPHPGVTDTENVQQRMLADLALGPLPVVVREHRFDDATLDGVKSTFQEHVAVGSALIDDWVRARYLPGPRFGFYEVMQPRPDR